MDWLIPKSTLRDLKYIENYNMYMDNMVSMGLFTKTNESYLTDYEMHYRPIENEYKEEIERNKLTISSINRIMELGKGYIQISQTGMFFLAAIGIE
jgi:hypothetical protein